MEDKIILELLSYYWVSECACSVTIGGSERGIGQVRIQLEFVTLAFTRILLGNL